MFQFLTFPARMFQFLTLGLNFSLLRRTGFNFSIYVSISHFSFAHVWISHFMFQFLTFCTPACQIGARRPYQVHGINHIIGRAGVQKGPAGVRVWPAGKVGIWPKGRNNLVLTFMFEFLTFRARMFEFLTLCLNFSLFVRACLNSSLHVWISHFSCAHVWISHFMFDCEFLTLHYCQRFSRIVWVFSAISN